jgi:hypothetical protein
LHSSSTPAKLAVATAPPSNSSYQQLHLLRALLLHVVAAARLVEFGRARRCRRNCSPWPPWTAPLWPARSRASPSSPLDALASLCCGDAHRPAVFARHRPEPPGRVRATCLHGQQPADHRGSGCAPWLVRLDTGKLRPHLSSAAGGHLAGFRPSSAALLSPACSVREEGGKDLAQQIASFQGVFCRDHDSFE